MQIQTARLILRPVQEGDARELHVMSSDPEVTRFVQALDLPAARQRVRLAEREWAARGYGLLTVLERAAGRFIGRAGFKFWPQFDETEVGWVLRRDAWGRGYATEAGRACVQWGFAAFAPPYLTAMIHPANDRSIRVAERLGFVPLRNDYVDGGPVVVYALQRT